MQSISEELGQFLAFYGGVLVVKMLLMSFLTGMQRKNKAVAATPEDVGLFGKKGKVATNDPDVERVRRAHQNDLENILPFFFIAIIYLTTNPGEFTAKMLIRTFAMARIGHTVVYVNAIPQPSRALVWFLGQAVTFYMAFSVIWHYA